MLTLALDHDNRWTALSEGLQGRWALILSDPRDFTPLPAAVFEQARVLPVTFAEQSSWCVRVGLRDVDTAAGGAEHLIDSITAVDDAFVLIADERLQLHQAHSYFAPGKAPSLRSLIRMVDRLRKAVTPCSQARHRSVA
jgi:hypothetical protein